MSGGTWGVGEGVIGRFFRADASANHAIRSLTVAVRCGVRVYSATTE